MYTDKQRERIEKASQELAKHEHRQGLLELRAPAEGTVKDLATHIQWAQSAPPAPS